ncbi:MAG: S1C family serine protease [Rubrivivax sp.]
MIRLQRFAQIQLPGGLTALRRVGAAAAAALALGLASASAATLEDTSRALQRASDAVLGIEVEAVEQARSSATLGTQRVGSGVVIGADGLVLTIGYLVLEAESVVLLPDDGRRVPARVVAYDVASGFGLVQALAPLRIEAVPLGRAAPIAAQEPLAFVSGGPQGLVTPVRLLERRPFSGSWEYHLEQALYTAPARRDHSGAALFNGRGELVGIGSLFLASGALSSAPRQSGNLFVPTDVLLPILDELRARGFSAASQRPWLGVHCQETPAGLRVVRVNDDSPADVAGLQTGDTIEKVDGVAVQGLAALYQTLWSKGPPEREVVLEVLREGSRQTLKVYSVDRMKTFRRAQGV